MKQLNLTENRKDQELKYIDPKAIITALERITGKNLEDLKTSVNEIGVTITLQEVNSYLDRVFNEQQMYPESEIMGVIKGERYAQAPDILEYLKRYINIVKTKSQTLLELIGKLSIKDLDSVKEYIDELDLSFDEEKNILSSDVERLIAPTIYNLTDLHNKVDESNAMGTYLTTRMPYGSSYECLYPSSSLQVKSLDNEEYGGYVPLTENQKQKIQQKDKDTIKTFVKSLPAWF